jgi:uroporphyrinogen-III synthase
MTPLRALVLRPYDRFSEILGQSGIEVVNLELITTEPIDDQAKLIAALAGPIRYDGFFITSPAAAAIVVECLETLGREHTGKIYVLGDRSRRLLEDAGINVEYCEEARTAGELISEFGEAEFAGKRLCFVRGDRSLRSIPTLLQNVAEVDEIVVYKTRESSPDLKTLEAVRSGLVDGRFDWAFVFSPSAAEAFETIVGPRFIAKMRTAAIGKTTAIRASQLGFDVSFVSSRPDAATFAETFLKQVNEI